MTRRHWLVSLGLALLSACGSDAPGGDRCTPSDQDSVVGGQTTVKLYVSDLGFSVGAQGSGQPNISVQNTSRVTLTIVNVGSRGHGFQIQCRPTELPAGCP